MIRERMTWMPDYVKVRNPAAWIDNYDYTSDDTAYDLAHLLWTYNYKEADAVPVVALIKGYIAKSLLIECPDHPSALADLIVNRWPETRARADQIERDMGAHPQVAYALARSYRSEGRLTDAVRLIQQVIEVAPDAGVYEELAELYKQQGDVDKWLDVYNKYLSSTEEFGLEHARKSEQIAYTLMRMKKLDRALPYAKAAAESYSAWGLNVYAHCLTEMGQYAQAEAIERACQERYPTGFAWYRWCQITGRGNLKDARALSESHSAEESDNDTAVYLQLDGQNDRAAACWEQIFAQKHDPYEALQLGMLDLEQGKPDVAKERVQRSHLDAPKMPKEAMAFMKNMMPPDYEVRLSIYRAAVHEVQRCLDDTSAVPNRDGEVKVIFDSKETPYPGNAEYFLGRLCELRGKKDDARWWYRTSLDSGEWTFSCRPQAAAGLRRLGEEYYK